MKYSVTKATGLVCCLNVICHCTISMSFGIVVLFSVVFFHLVVCCSFVGRFKKNLWSLIIFWFVSLYVLICRFFVRCYVVSLCFIYSSFVSLCFVCSCVISSCVILSFFPVSLSSEYPWTWFAQTPKTLFAWPWLSNSVLTGFIPLR